MPLKDENNNVNFTGSDESQSDQTLSMLLSSDRWIEYFKGLAEAVHFELSGYDAEGGELFLENENPFCAFNRSRPDNDIDCPNSCHELMKSDEPKVFRCRSKILCFSFPVQEFGEKAFIVGRGSFSAYDDFADFLETVGSNQLPELPISMPLQFTGEDHLRSVSQFISLSIKRQLKNYDEKYKLEEKFMRITSLFDSQAFGTLSKSPELMHRYILDTIDFVFGETSAGVMVPDENELIYKTVYSTGKEREHITHVSIKSESPLIKKISDIKSPVLFEGKDHLMTESQFEGYKFSHFFPVISGGAVSALIVIYNREISREDVKILNAFREYVQLNLENNKLRDMARTYKMADEKLAYLSDLTKSIISIVDKDRLLSTLLEKSLQIINAEQGSLMLLDHETSELVVEARKSVDDTVQKKMRFKKGEGICGMVLEKGGSLLVEDIESDPRVKQANRPRYRTKSFLSVPIRIENRMEGVLNLADKVKGRSFDKDDLNLIESFLGSVAIAIERSLLYRQAEKLQKLSITDPLTGIYNRRYLNRRLSEEITRYNRFQHPFSFMMLDLDKFKEYNDTFGHIAGDELIRNLASVMEKSLRTIDIAARFGGDEFVAIFPQTPKVDAIQISNRLKDQIEKALRLFNVEMPLSISMGLATFPDDASSIMELIEKTDQALYLAKKGGGNRVVYL